MTHYTQKENLRKSNRLNVVRIRLLAIICTIVTTTSVVVAQDAAVITSPYFCEISQYKQVKSNEIICNDQALADKYFSMRTAYSAARKRIENFYSPYSIKADEELSAELARSESTIEECSDAICVGTKLDSAVIAIQSKSDQLMTAAVELKRTASDASIAAQLQTQRDEIINASVALEKQRRDEALEIAKQKEQQLKIYGLIGLTTLCLLIFAFFGYVLYHKRKKQLTQIMGIQPPTELPVLSSSENLVDKTQIKKAESISSMEYIIAEEKTPISIAKKLITLSENLTPKRLLVIGAVVVVTPVLYFFPSIFKLGTGSVAVPESLSCNAGEEFPTDWEVSNYQFYFEDKQPKMLISNLKQIVWGNSSKTNTTRTLETHTTVFATPSLHVVRKGYGTMKFSVKKVIDGDKFKIQMETSSKVHILSCITQD